MQKCKLRIHIFGQWWLHENIWISFHIEYSPENNWTKLLGIEDFLRTKSSKDHCFWCPLVCKAPRPSLLYNIRRAFTNSNEPSLKVQDDSKYKMIKRFRDGQTIPLKYGIFWINWCAVTSRMCLFFNWKIYFHFLLKKPSRKLYVTNQGCCVAVRPLLFVCIYQWAREWKAAYAILKVLSLQITWQKK